MLNGQKLDSRARKAGSDFYARHGKVLARSFAIEREPCRVRVINWEWMSTSYKRAIAFDEGNVSRWNRFIEAYFYYLSDAYFEDFWENFVEEQALQLAVGAQIGRASCRERV